MTITTTHCKTRCEGFTLIDVLIGLTIGTLVLAGVLTTFLMLGRSGANIGNYCTMETESRRALEELSQDLRMAKNVIWNSAQSVTLEVPENYTATGNRVTYALDSTTGAFYRMPGVEADSNPRMTLIRSVASCTFARFDRANFATESPASTKRVHLTLVVRKKSQTVAAASNTILSASYILRNKPAN